LHIEKIDPSIGPSEGGTVINVRNIISNNNIDLGSRIIWFIHKESEILGRKLPYFKWRRC